MTPPDSAIRVLLADDSREFRELLSLLLSRDARFEIVAEAKDGIEAIEMTKEQQPDVLLLDIAMPAMDGLQALPELKKGHPSVKVVVLSSFSESEMRDKALGLGADAYVEKGESLVKITETIVSLCRS